MVECLCFRNGQRPSDDTIDGILRVITEKEIRSHDGKSKLLMNPITRSLLVQIVFKNYNEIVIKHLRNWFNNNSLVGLFESSQEIALLFQNCVYDQYIHQASNLQLDDQLVLAHRLLTEMFMNSNKEAFKQMLIKTFNEKRIKVSFFLRALFLKA